MKKPPKVHSGSFFLEPSFLAILDQASGIEGQSRARFVERAMRFLLAKGESHARWKKSKRAYKSAQKIHTKRSCSSAFQDARAPRETKPKRPIARRAFAELVHASQPKPPHLRPCASQPSLFSALEECPC